jgi:hypothetical protein
MESRLLLQHAGALNLLALAMRDWGAEARRFAKVLRIDRGPGMAFDYNLAACGRSIPSELPFKR